MNLAITLMVENMIFDQKSVKRPLYFGTCAFFLPRVEGGSHKMGRWVSRSLCLLRDGSSFFKSSPEDTFSLLLEIEEGRVRSTDWLLPFSAQTGDGLRPGEVVLTAQHRVSLLEFINSAACSRGLWVSPHSRW